MSEKIEIAQKLIDFIYESPSSFHAVKNIKSKLLENKFTELKLRDKWYIEKGGRYFVTQNDSAIISFLVGSGEIEKTGFRIIGAHTDAPSFRIKPFPEIISEGYVKLNTEVYGGPILNTWMDRPLSIAGRVSLISDDILYPQIELVNIRRPILIIPNLAIHMNRKVNEGIEFDNEEIGSKTKQGAGSPMLRNVIARIVLLLGGDKEDLHRSLYSSFIISADMTHAVHPNYSEKHDPIIKPIINKGPVIKINANQRYTTDSDSDAVYELICKMSGGFPFKNS